MVVVYQKPDDPYLSELLVAIVTKTGQYLNMSQAQHMIVKGEITVDGTVERNPAKVLKPGLHEFTLRDRKMVVEVREMESL